MSDYETVFLVVVLMITFIILIIGLSWNTNNGVSVIKGITNRVENYKDLSLISSNWSNFDAISDINMSGKNVDKINKLNFDNFGSIFTNEINNNQSITLLSSDSFDNSYININGKLSLQNNDNLCYIYSNEQGLNFDIKESKINFDSIDSNYTKMTSSKGILSNTFKPFNEITIEPEHTYESNLELNSINHISIPNTGSKDAVIRLPSENLYNGVSVEIFRSPQNILSNLVVQYKDSNVSVISGMNANKLYRFIYSSKLDIWYEIK
jgi:hypothetical protein